MAGGYNLTFMKKEFALLINDIHVSASNIPDFLKNWEEAVGVCRKRNIDRIVIGGDLWQSRAAQSLSVLKAVQSAFLHAVNNGIQIVVAEGNHDKVDQEDTYGYSHIFSNMKNVSVVDDVVTIPVSDHIDLYVMSYFPESGSFVERLRGVVRCMSKPMNIFYVHEGVRGALGVENDKEVPAEEFAGITKTLVGHYHNRSQIKDTSIYYIGSSRQHGFGEDEEKGYTILYTDGSIEFVKNEVNTRYATITMDAGEKLQDVVQKIQNIKSDSRYKVRVKVSGTKEQIATLDKTALLSAGVSKIDVQQIALEDASISSGFDSRFDKDGIKKEYLFFCEANNIQETNLGLKYLDKIQ